MYDEMNREGDNINPDTSVTSNWKEVPVQPEKMEQNFAQSGQQSYNQESDFRNYQNQYYANTSENETPGKDHAALKKQKTKHDHTNGKVAGFFRKMLVSASLGICFGLCAAVGLYGVLKSTDMLDRVIDEKVALSVSNVPKVSGINGTDQNVNATSVSYDNTTKVVTSDVSSMVESVMPAMVSIVNSYDEVFDYWGQRFTQENESSGSGIIVGQNDNEILIVTNYHVVQDAKELQVTFVNGSTAVAQMKGSNAGMDIAVIAVPLSEMDESTKDAIVVATLGDSDELKLGEPAIAIGNALGYGQSVTTGVISALNREMELSDDTTGTFIQTSAAINPGNSGGALLNIEGQVVGINSNKIGGSYIEGMGYAIPISVAKPIIAELMLKQTKVKVSEEQKGYLGITLVSVTEEDAQMYDMPRGIFVTSIEPESAAENAGLMKRDIIVGFDGETIKGYDDLEALLEYYPAGSTVTLDVMRGNNGVYEQIQLQITLGKRAS